MSNPETDVAEKPPVSIWKRLFLAAGAFVVLVSALAIGQYFWQGRLRPQLAEGDNGPPGRERSELAAR